MHVYNGFVIFWLKGLRILCSACDIISRTVSCTPFTKGTACVFEIHCSMSSMATK